MAEVADTWRIRWEVGGWVYYLCKLLVSQRFTYALTTCIEESERFDWMICRIGTLALRSHIEQQTSTQILVGVKHNSHLLIILDRIEIVF